MDEDQGSVKRGCTPERQSPLMSRPTSMYFKLSRLLPKVSLASPTLNHSSVFLFLVWFFCFFVIHLQHVRKVLQRLLVITYTSKQRNVGFMFP